MGGLVLAVFSFISQANDLLARLVWTETDVSKMFEADTAEWVTRSMPPQAWLISSSVAGMALAVLLFVGATRLRQRVAAGVRLCRVWAWMAIAWGLTEMALALVWIVVFFGELPEGSGSDWLGRLSWASALERRSSWLSRGHCSCGCRDPGSSRKSPAGRSRDPLARQTIGRPARRSQASSASWLGRNSSSG